MKSFSKRVASFTMAAAMVLSLAAVSPVDAQAAKKASITKKSSIKAGKAYTYNIKNVTSKQYVKVTGITSGVTVKYNNKTVKKNSTKIYGKKSGKALALKVTAKDKIANYKATIKAQVYNKSNHKKVGSLLKTTTTVKCTKLAIKSVEPATLNNEHKYIVVSFNRALDSLDPSEVSIRQKDTNQLVTLEKVALASNGKSATLTLLGDKNVANTDFLLANTDYVLSVDKAGVTAAMDFNFAAVNANETVTKVDATKRTISAMSIIYPVGGGAPTVTTTDYTVPTTISVDFQDILGRTVTYWYNKNNQITKLVVANETVVYGAFGAVKKSDTTTSEFADKTSDAKYVDCLATPSGTSNIYQTRYIKAKGGFYGVGTLGATPAAAYGATPNTVDYAKLVLNPNGTIRAAVIENNMIANRILVASVAENVATESKTKSVNLKDYTIVKDGKTIAIADIQAGDVLFYNAGDKYAEVYTTKVTGAVTAVTDKKVTVADKTYEYYNGLNGSSKTSYVENNESKVADSDYFVAVKKAAKDATLYLDRTGKVVYASGDKGTVATSTRDIILTDVAKTYSQSLESYIRLAGSDATTTAVPEIKLSELKTVKVTTGTSTTTYTKDTVAGTTKVKKFDSFDAVAPNATPADYTITQITYTEDDGSTDGLADQTIAFSPSAADIVVLTLDSTNTKVIGIELVKTTITLKTDDKTTFEKGKSTIAGNDTKNYQIVSSTPVYEINKDSAVSKVTYGEYAKKTLATKAANVKIFADNKGNVTKIVINDKGNDTYGITDTATKTGVVIGKETLNGKVASFTIVSEGQKVEFTSFVDDYKTTLAEGDIVDVEYEKSSNKVKSITASIGAGVNTVTTNKTKENMAEAVVVNGKIVDTTSGATVELDLASSITPTIVQKDGDNWKVITYGELSDLASTATSDINITYHKMVDKVIDYIVVK